MITFQEANLIDVIKSMMETRRKQREDIQPLQPLYVAQGCNCFGAMAAGFAAQVARHFPEAAKIDQVYHKAFVTPEQKERDQLGGLSAANIGASIVMFNLYSQLYPGADFRLDAFERAFDEMMLRIEEAPNSGSKPVLLMPRIGAGIGGGKWEEILTVIKNYEEIVDIIVFDYKPMMIVSSNKTHYEDYESMRYNVEDLEQE